MRVLHLNYMPTINIGKVNKLTQQAQAAQELGLPIDFLVINDQLTKTTAGLCFVKMKLPANRFIKNVIQKVDRYKLIAAHTDLENYDLLVMRYPIMQGRGWRSWFENCRIPIVLECHTFYHKELEYYFSNPALSRWVSRGESKNSKRVSQYISGIIGVTGEITEYYQNHFNTDHAAVMANGCSVADFPVRTLEKGESDIIHLLFVASIFSPWHGLDRILKSLAEYSGPPRIRLSVVGDPGQFSSDLVRFESSGHKWVDLSCPGVLTGDDLTQLYNRAHIAISSMALFRNDLHEASTLKTREYTARCIPYIYGYHDSDLSGTENFALRVSNDEQLIKFSEVIEYFKPILQKNEYQREMRAHAVETMDWRIKLKNVYRYLNQVKDSSPKLSNPVATTAH